MNDALETLANEDDEAAQWLNLFFKNPKPSALDMKKARIVTSHRSTQVRAHQAITGRERQKFSVARLLTEDDEEARAYLRASLPKP